MKLPTSENLRWYGMVLGLSAVLVLLAVLQYRSSRAVSEATIEQMRASLQGSLLDVRQGLERELAPLCRELQFGSDVPRPNGPSDYVSAFERWHRAAAHPTLVADVFLWQHGNGSQFQLLKLNSNHTAFEAADWPQKFDNLHARLLELTPALHGPGNGFSPGTPPDQADQFRPPFPGDAGAARDIDHEPPPDHTGDFQRGPGDVPGADTRRRETPPRDFGHGPAPGENPEFGWIIDESVAALVHAVYEPRNRGMREPGMHESKSPSFTWVVVVLNHDVLEQHVLPELVQRYFGSGAQSSYEIAVIDRSAPNVPLFSSDFGFGSQPGITADASLELFGGPGPMSGPRPRSGPVAVPNMRPTPGPSHKENSHGPRWFHDEDRFRIDAIHYSQGPQGWEIVAKHRDGSVEAAVAALTRRNLMFNFAVLFVLAITMGMIIATSQRARRLGRLQMDFVAGVSHELRTPLTGIVAAAQNIADGVVSDKERMAQYGKAIVGQAQQLSELVEQILLFSATEKDRHRYNFQDVDVVEVIDASIQNTLELIQSSGIEVEREVQKGLPSVWADAKALAQCLQNLIANAAKYGGDGRWIGIRASLSAAENGQKEVAISVADKGVGISQEDLNHIFEPFYRSPKVTAAQIHGSGLGLPLAKSIAEAMGGRLTVKTAVEKGSTFTVHLPVK